jgi:hypothetical protein
VTTPVSQKRQHPASASQASGPYPWLTELVLSAEQIDALRLHIERTLQLDEEGPDQ